MKKNMVVIKDKVSYFEGFKTKANKKQTGLRYVITKRKR
jgi:hypothetical protein